MTLIILHDTSMIFFVPVCRAKIIRYFLMNATSKDILNLFYNHSELTESYSIYLLWKCSIPNFFLDIYNFCV